MCEDVEFTPLEEMASQVEDIGFKEDAYLRKMGWEHTSSGNPCCFWLWNNKEHGFVGMSKNIAVSTQIAIDQTEN